MANFGNFDFTKLLNIQRQINGLGNPDEFVDDCAKTLAAMLLEKVIERTPVGDYTIEVEKIAKRTSKNHQKGDKYTVKKSDGSGRKGGNLRRGWTIGKIKQSGNTVYIEVFNPVEYAPYVEYGHRQTPGRFVPALGKQLKAGWVNGKFMLKLSVEEVQSIADDVIKEKMKEYFGGAFK